MSMIHVESGTKPPCTIDNRLLKLAGIHELAMPEGTVSSMQEGQLSLQPVDFSMDDFEREAGLLLEPAEEWSLNRSRDSAKSIESLNTLLMSMPEISIPSPVRNPLPLQCLAASALPAELRREIDGLIAECALFCEDQDQAPAQEAASSAHTPDSDATVTDLDGSRTTGDAEEVDCASAEQGAAATGVTVDYSNDVEIKWTILKKQPTQYDDVGVGLKIMGGVKCDRCLKLHAVITSVFASNKDHLHADIKEGVCILNWGDHSLDGLSFEGVRRVLEGDDNNKAEVEVGFMTCSDNLLSSYRGRALSTNFTVSGTNEVKNAASSHSEIAQDFIDGDDTMEAASLPSSDYGNRDSLSLISASLTNNVTNIEVTTDSNITSMVSGSGRPSSLEIPGSESHHSGSDGQHQQTSISRSPSPAPNGGERVKNITVPKFDLTAQALLAAMEAKPKSPLLAEDLQHIFDQLPSGMMQLSVKYDANLEDLSITLNQVKGQSLGDMFINTYLIPDNRHQGVRSVKVTASSRNGSSDNTHTLDSPAAYMVTESELSSLSLRVILWDAKKSKNIAFRGEVLLGLSDDIVNLGGEPTWYNVCPEDPNLPSLPPPMHYKSKSHPSVEQLLNKFKSNFATLKFKSSRSVLSNLDLSASDSTLSLPLAIMKRRRSVPRDRLLRTQNSRPDSSGYQYDEGFKERDVYSSIESEEETKAQMVRLASILKVLKDTAESEDSLSAGEALEAENQATRKNKLHSILQVLRDETPPESTGDNSRGLEPIESTDGGHLHLPVSSTAPFDDGTYSTLDRRVRKRKPRTDQPSRPKSDSFNSIPNLRNSLSSRGKSKVPTYSFLEEMKSSVQLQTQRESLAEAEDINSLDDDERSDLSFAEHYRLIDEGQSDSEHEPPPPAQTLTGVEYDKVDPCASLLPTMDVTTASSKPSDCTYYPAEVSLHRINVVDVDREKREREKRRKAASLPSPAKKPSRPLALNLATTLEMSELLSAKARSKSLGDMDELESEEELIMVRSPMTPGGELDGGSGDFLDVVEPFPREGERMERDDGAALIQREARGDSTTVSSLDFSEQPRPRQVSMVRIGDKEERAEKSSKGDKNMSKWKSLDNLLTGSLPRRTKKNKKKHLAVKSSLNRMNSAPPDNSSSSPGTVELELQYNDLNPLHPVLLVKLTDVIFYSTKGLSSEFTMKSYVYHRSTKVCILKNKANINMKIALPSAPLGLMQFETDITNLSLQVCLYTNSKLFSRKLIGEVWIELDTLSLSHDSPHTDWYSLTRQTVQS